MAHLSLVGTGFSPFARMLAATVEMAQQFGKVWTAMSNRRAVRSLYGYDERMLKDIGLVSSDLDAAMSCRMVDDPSRHLASVAAGRGRKRR